MSPDPILDKLKAALTETYGDRLERIVLFGSRARGDFTPESDYDIAVFIRDPESRWDEMGRLAMITTDLLMDTGAIISAKPFPAEAYHEPRSLMRAIRRDGMDL